MLAAAILPGYFWPRRSMTIQAHANADTTNTKQLQMLLYTQNTASSVLRIYYWFSLILRRRIYIYYRYRRDGFMLECIKNARSLGSRPGWLHRLWLFAISCITHWPRGSPFLIDACSAAAGCQVQAAYAYDITICLSQEDRGWLVMLPQYDI